MIVQMWFRQCKGTKIHSFANHRLSPTDIVKLQLDTSISKLTALDARERCHRYIYIILQKSYTKLNDTGWHFWRNWLQKIWPKEQPVFPCSWKCNHTEDLPCCSQVCSPWKDRVMATQLPRHCKPATAPAHPATERWKRALSASSWSA